MPIMCHLLLFTIMLCHRAHVIPYTSLSHCLCFAIYLLVHMRLDIAYAKSVQYLKALLGKEILFIRNTRLSLEACIDARI